MCVRAWVWCYNYKVNRRLLAAKMKFHKLYYFNGESFEWLTVLNCICNSRYANVHLCRGAFACPSLFDSLYCLVLVFNLTRFYRSVRMHEFRLEIMPIATIAILSAVASFGIFTRVSFQLVPVVNFYLSCPVCLVNRNTGAQRMYSFTFPVILCIFDSFEHLSTFLKHVQMLLLLFLHLWCANKSQTHIFM